MRVGGERETSGGDARGEDGSACSDAVDRSPSHRCAWAGVGGAARRTPPRPRAARHGHRVPPCGGRERRPSVAGEGGGSGVRGGRRRQRRRLGRDRREDVGLDRTHERGATREREELPRLEGRLGNLMR